MATYYQGNSDIQGADGLQTLVLMNPSCVQYSDTPPPPPTGNLIFFNSPATSLAPQGFPHAPSHHTQQFVGIPFQAAAAAAATSQYPNSHSMHVQHDISPMHGFAPRVQDNIWNSVDPTTEASETPRAQRGLSLSLSSQQHGYGSLRNERDVPSQGQAEGMSAENMRVSRRSSSGVTNGISAMQSALLSSKYLKAAKELLEEVVNVGGVVKSELMMKANSQGKGAGESSVAATSAGGDTTVKPATELTTAERQEIQMKKAKLISMLDEVEQRYRQYHHHIQIMISSFEQAAGVGSARTYTALALKTISKQFKCLKDAIMGQVRAANKSLGEEDSHGGKVEGSRLKFVDHQLRQQRALQQLGMIQHNAWRPQRGLPERAVSVLRAWLFEHFLHPYPKDSDKTMLAKQTGLTRSQVSNWFINARVRLWKPMVEEMYQEELKENEKHGSEETASKNDEKDGSGSKSSAQQEKNYGSQNQNKNSHSKQDIATVQHNSAISTSMVVSAGPLGGSVQKQSGFTVVEASELEGITQGSPKKQRSLNMLHSQTSAPTISMDAKPLDVNNQQVSREGYSIMAGSPPNFTGGFGQYSIGELGRFDTEQFTPGFSGNNFSLSLGLPPCDNMSLSGNHHNFLPDHNIPLGRTVDIGGSNEFGSINTSVPPSAAAYDNMDIQNRKRFAAQMLHDFVS